MSRPKTQADTSVDYRPYAFAVLEVMRDRGALNTIHAPVLIAFVRDSGGVGLDEIAEYLGVTREAVEAAYAGAHGAGEVAA
jgi:hypothetical protein